MIRNSAFDKLLKLADALPLDQKEVLADILRQRALRQRTAQLARDIRTARKDRRRGRTKPTSPSELMREITQ